VRLERIPSRGFLLGSVPFARPEPRLGQFDWIPALITGALQAAPAAVAAYNAKRAADRAKQDKQRQEAATNAANEAQAKAEAEAKAKAEEAAKNQTLIDQGLTPSGVPSNKILGLDPFVLAVGGIGILGVGAALFMALRK
jgi:hypothetical protein